MTKHMEGQIVKDVPIPSARNGKYKFDQLKVGESIWYEQPISYVSSLLAALRHRASAKGTVLEFTSRTEDGGTRVWRTK